MQIIEALDTGQVRPTDLPSTLLATLLHARPTLHALRALVAGQNGAIVLLVISSLMLLSFTLAA